MTEAVSYRLGVDVGGTFTDLLLINSQSSKLTAKMKVPSTPHDPSEGVLNGITKICAKAGIDPKQISTVFHGTTVATNAVLEGKGVKVGLITTEGYKQVLHIGRSFVPGGLAGWIIWNRSDDLAPLEATIEAKGRVDSKGNIVTPLDQDALRSQLMVMRDQEVQAITVSLFNSYLNPTHELQVRELVKEVLPDIPISLSCEVLPEMYEYERALTTVTNSYIRPNVSMYMKNLQKKLGKTDLRVLRSDGGLCSEANASNFPVNLLMSGPAGGVAGALWVSEKSGFPNVITLDMGGTSTDVALIHDGIPKTRRETKVGDVTVRATSLDVHTVGAGGGSIAHVPDLTKALRVGPQSAGARPGPACYGHGGADATVTDANIVLGYLPSVLLGGDMKLDVEAAHTAVQAVADKLGVGKYQAATGIVDIVNENMVGAMRKVSIEKGYDSRDFALCAFGGGGALQANAIGIVMDSWPVIVPPSPGLLCAYGDATTRSRYESSKSYVKSFAAIDCEILCEELAALGKKAAAGLEADRVPLAEQELQFQADLRYKGQGLTLPLVVSIEMLSENGVTALAAEFDAEHRKLFHFSFDRDHEMVNLRAVAQSGTTQVEAPQLAKGTAEAVKDAQTGTQEVFMGGKKMAATLWDRSQLLAGNQITGPAIICEFDSTTLVLVNHVATIDGIGNILIRPSGDKEVVSSVENSFSLDVIENALRHSRFEMDAVVFRSAMSPGIREQHDQFPMICDAKGKMVVGQFGSFITGFLKLYKEPIEEGDVILLSDPYSCEGAISHANDWLVLTPIFVAPDGKEDSPNTKLVGWAAMFGHTTDCGGKTPCSMPNDAHSIFEEAVVIPPVKLYAKGKLNADLLKLILHNCRTPIWNHCDLMALVASINVGRDRVVELCGRFGAEMYCKTLDKMLERNKTAMAQLIHTSVSTEPLYFEDYICDDAVGNGPYKICCSMWREGDNRVVFDFKGTDPQTDGSANFFLNPEMFKMFMGSYMIMVFDPQIIFNDGFYDLVDVRIPDGSLLKPRFPAALSCRTHALGRIFDILGGLLGQRAPQLMTAAGFSDSPHFMYSGKYAETGEWYQLYSISFGGIPGRPFGDGPDGHSLWPSFSNVPNEFLEQYFPLRVEAMYTIPDSGGAGLNRGGNGINAVYRFLEDGAVSNHDDRWLTYPWGVNGGTPGSRSTKVLYRGCPEGTLTGGTRTVVPSKGDNILVKKGDVLHYITWGGGGWGRPEQRDVDKVMRDVRQGLVSVQGAARYGVVITETSRAIGPPLLAVDEAATKAARAVMSRKHHEMFDFGFKKAIRATPEDLAALAASCMAETGLAAPALPKGSDAEKEQQALVAARVAKTAARDMQAAKVVVSAAGKLKGKVALVTGASSGIGKGVAMGFAAEGASVAVNYHTHKANAEAVVQAIVNSGASAFAVEADVSDEEQVHRMVKQTLSKFGRIDILVNNAGIASKAPIGQMKASMWDQMINVNLRSVFLCTNAVLPHMYDQNYGKIICTTSQLAYKGAPGYAHYTACKGAIMSFVRSVSLEIGARPININCVAPGATVTPIHGGVGADVLDAIRARIPRGKMAEVEDIVPSYVFLASEDANHFVGQCISPNGGDVFL